MEYSRYNIEVEWNGKIILYNSLHNKYAILSIDELNMLKNNTAAYIQTHSQITSNKLLEYGFIVDSLALEENEVADLFFSQCYDSSKFNFTIIPTNACDLKCPYCFAPRSSEYMDEYVQQAVIDYIASVIENKSHQLKHLTVKWFGGEPLLACDRISTITNAVYLKCQEYKIQYHANIHSNLAFCTDKEIDCIKRAHIDIVHTTLAGTEAMTHKKRPAKSGNSYFSNLISTVKKIMEFANVEILVSIDQENRENIFDLLTWIQKEGLLEDKNVNIGFNLIRENSNFRENDGLLKYTVSDTIEYINSLYTMLGNNVSLTLPQRGVYCFAQAKNSAVILPDGSLKKCEFGPAFGSVFSPHTIGKDYYFAQTHFPFKYPECVDCSVFPLCFSGCHSADGEICILRYTIKEKIRRYFEQHFGNVR